ncbi:MAG: ribonuclease P protein component [Alphaproteobacteria bacterium]|nr:MAG: ribonuclease P protein component [Alphaproteobacteria bacterium]
MRKRPQYQYVSHSGNRFFCRYFLLQGVCTPADPSLLDDMTNQQKAQIRFGFIVTRKNGGAVVRNRIKRRLKEACRATLHRQKLSLDCCVDIVVIGNARCTQAPFCELVESLEKGIQDLCVRVGAR